MEQPKVFNDERSLETVDFSRAPGEVASATDFLRDHVDGRIKTKGSRILVDGAKHREVKLLLHKFLHQRSLDGYRVISQSGILEIVPPHITGPVKHAEGGSAPSAALTMPYFFPGSPPIPVERKIKKRREDQ
jgi:hypothetical protein